ncbi:unnamed protein product [Laminaria digitata]
MRTRFRIAAVALLGSVGAANAADVFVASDTLNDNQAMIDGFAANLGIDVSKVRVNTASTLGSSSLGFTSVAGGVGDNGAFSVAVATTVPNSGNFYLDNVNLGQAGGLRNIDFNGGDESAPSDNPFALAFGNNSWTSESMTLSFSPNVTAFGFNYEDIGDVGATLLVTFNDGSEGTLSINDDTARGDGDGFISIVYAAGISSITLVQQNPQANDGFIFYGFQTVQAVPVPPAALAGLGLLGGMGIARRIKRSRA